MHGIYAYASWEHSPFSQKRYADLIERPHIVYYTFTGKPWKPGRRHPEQAFRSTNAAAPLTSP
jgi:hypothetical protein